MPIIPGFVWSAVMLLLSLVSLVRNKDEDEQLEAGDEEEMKVQVSLEN